MKKFLNFLKVNFQRMNSLTADDREITDEDNVFFLKFMGSLALFCLVFIGLMNLLERVLA